MLLAFKQEREGVQIVRFELYIFGHFPGFIGQLKYRVRVTQEGHKDRARGIFAAQGPVWIQVQASAVGPQSTGYAR